jgi:biotin operon repressor
MSVEAALEYGISKYAMVLPLWLVTDKRLSPLMLRVLLVLLACDPGRYGKAHVAQETIAERLGVGARTIRRAIKDLRSLGLNVEKVGADGANTYDVRAFQSLAPIAEDAEAAQVSLRREAGQSVTFKCGGRVYRIDRRQRDTDVLLGAADEARLDQPDISVPLLEPYYDSGLTRGKHGEYSVPHGPSGTYTIRGIEMSEATYVEGFAREIALGDASAIDIPAELSDDVRFAILARADMLTAVYPMDAVMTWRAVSPDAIRRSYGPAVDERMRQMRGAA